MKKHYNKAVDNTVTKVGRNKSFVKICIRAFLFSLSDIMRQRRYIRIKGYFRLRLHWKLYKKIYLKSRKK